MGEGLDFLHAHLLSRRPCQRRSRVIPLQASTLWALSALAGIVVGAVWNYAMTATYTWKKNRQNLASDNGNCRCSKPRPAAIHEDDAPPTASVPRLRDFSRKSIFLVLFAAFLERAR